MDIFKGRLLAVLDKVASVKEVIIKQRSVKWMSTEILEHFNRFKFNRETATWRV